MDFVTIVGLIFMGLIFVLSAFLGLKEYKKLSLKKSTDYFEEDTLKEEIEESSDLIKMYSDKSENERPINTSNNVLSSAVLSSSRTEKENRTFKSNSSLRNAAISFNKKEHERERSGSNDGWNPTTNNLYATSYVEDTPTNNCEHKESIFNSESSGFGGSFSSTNDSTFASYSSDSYSGGGDSGGSCD